MAEGLLLIDKPEGRSSFSLIPKLRSLCQESCIGHAGTLDPFATGLMLYLVGRAYTSRAEGFSGASKVYRMGLRLGRATETYDLQGKETARSSSLPPTFREVEQAIALFQGKSFQTPPMFSAKKQKGVPLYKMARRGKEVYREPCQVEMQITLLKYAYPDLFLSVAASKGTYMRSLAHDLGIELGTYAYAFELRRIQSAAFSIEQAYSWEKIENAFEGKMLLSLDP